MTLADSSNSQISGRLSPTGIALSYGIFAALWIVISGYLLMLTVSDPLLQNRIELTKGLAFVVTTSALLYLLLSRWHAAVENTVAQSNRALDELRRKEKELFTLLKVSRELTSTLDLHGVLQITTDRVTELSELQSAAIYLLDGDALRLWAATPPLPPQFPEALRNAPLADHPHIRKAISTGMPVFVPDTTSTDLTPAERAVTELRDLRSVLYLPLLAETKVTGTLIVASVSETKALSETQTDLCRTLANMAALAVENACLYESSCRYAVELEQRVADCEGAEKVLRASEDELKKTKGRYDYATSVGKVGTWDWNLVTDDLIWNDEGFRFIGLMPGAVSPSYELFMEKVHQEDRKLVDSAVQSTLRENKPYSIDFRIVLEGGVERTYHAVGKVEFDENDQPVRMLGTMQDITERKQMENAIRQENNFRKDLINSLPGAFYMLDASGRYLMWNKHLEDVLQRSGEEILHGRPLDFFEEPDRSLIKENIRKVFEAGESALEAAVVAKDGTKTPYYLTGRRIERNGEPVLIGLGIDITERKRVEDALRDSETLYRYMFQSNPHPMWVFDLETLRFLAVNDAAIAHYGYSRELFLNMTIEDIRPLEDIPRLMQNLNHPVEAGIDEAGVWRHRKQDGTLIDVEITSHRMNFGGRNAELVLAHDVTERKQAEERVRKLAHFDSLTGLPNRTLLTDRVSQTISMAQRSHGKLAILFVDLDHFKNINDTLGHRIGDGLLVEVAKRLQSVVRDEDTVSRLGGDEFILLLPGTDTDGVVHVARKLLQAVSQHYLIEQHELVITPSIGIAMYPSDGENFEALSRCADIAMYRAKRDGRNNFRFFTPEMQARSARNLRLENALRRALERGQLQLHYQPQMSLQNGRIIGAEALLRWQHPDLGMVSPAEFIPVAEDSGLILTIGEWVLRTAIRQLKTWMDSGIAPMIISVNLSAVQFREPRLLKLVTQMLKEEGLPPQYLELELTEGVTMNDPVTAVRVMDRLHERGIRMSIDDFGTGYSSLSQLKRFQVYKLKIDQSFVRDVVDDPDDKAIVKAIINVAKGLGLRTIAEGVETQEQLEFLQENGCDEIQGFHYSRPITADQFETFVRGMTQ